MSSGNACWIWSKRGCSRGSFPAGWRRPEVDAEPTKRSDPRGGGQNAEQSQQHYIDRDSGTEGSNPAPEPEDAAGQTAPTPEKSRRSRSRSRWDRRMPLRREQIEDQLRALAEARASSLHDAAAYAWVNCMYTHDRLLEYKTREFCFAPYVLEC